MDKQFDKTIHEQTLIYWSKNNLALFNFTGMHYVRDGVQ